ncbi:MAG: PorP/SprF family type IX secretion system membrane protein [Bacteroidales bacterium]|nr:PorP/SprF family type IX secretion system membrane protein [Bacteroidales bacterium]
MKLLTIILFHLLFICITYGQDFHYSQYYANPLYLAPSMAGSTGESRVNMQYRDQWPSIPGRIVAFSFSGDHYFNKFKSGLGLKVMKDVAGTNEFSISQIGISYSYVIKLNHYWTVRPGLGFYYTQRSISTDNIIFPDQLIGEMGIPSAAIGTFSNTNNVDIESSIMLNTSNFWLGVNVDHLTRPNMAFYNTNYRIPIKMSVFTGYRFPFFQPYKKKFKHSISISANYYLQGDNDQLDIGIYWKFNSFLTGFWYRGLPSFKQKAISDAAIIMVGYEYNKLRIGYSYDLTISKLGPSTGGAHELAISYAFSINERKKKISVPCPDF